MSISVGDIIWIAIKPIVKIYLIIGTGFYLSRRNVLPIETARNISDIVITILIPCLTFNKIVTNVADKDIKNIGIICLTSLLLYGIGGLGAFAIKLITPAPKAWVGGLLMAGILPNVQDLTVAMLQTIDTGVVFTKEEADKGVTYVILFFTTFTIVLFNFGGFRLVEWDFMRERRRKEQLQLDKYDDMNPVAPKMLETIDKKKQTNERYSSSASSLNDRPIALHRSNTHSSSIQSVHSCGVQSMSRISKFQTIDDVITDYRQENVPNTTISKILTTDVGITTADITGESSGSKFMQRYHLGFLVFFLQNCIRPCSIAAIVALIIAFVPWLKALFVHTTVYIHDAPDELPPLSFIMDYTSYVSAAAIPFALLLLGATIAKIEITTIPDQFWKTASALTLLRLVILPILGVLWAKALVSMGWVNKDDKIFLFVLIVTCGLPTMTSIIYFTAFQTASLPDSEERIQMNCVGLIFLVQYPVLFITLPILISYVLKKELGF